MATVRMMPAAARALDDLPIEIHTRVLGILERLGHWPGVSGAKPLRGDLAGEYRVRTGDYRVQFSVTGRGRDSVVTVTKIGRRDGFYDE